MSRNELGTIIDAIREEWSERAGKKVMQYVGKFTERARIGKKITAVAVNNRISQSVPHLHIHIVPRRRKDGLKGFFWPRNPYRDEAHIAEVRDALRKAVGEIRSASSS